MYMYSELKRNFETSVARTFFVAVVVSAKVLPVNWLTTADVCHATLT